MDIQEPYFPKNKIRIVTAASLFDGHDVSINIMRRILQSSGAEVIHLGHNRSAGEIVATAIQEDVQAIAITSYQGGHNEYFKYVYDLLKNAGSEHIKIFGGGGGVILPEEIEDLHQYGITRIYSPDDGRTMGLQGMINDLLQKSDFPLVHGNLEHSGSAEKGVSGEVSEKVFEGIFEGVFAQDFKSIAQAITEAEFFPERIRGILQERKKNRSTSHDHSHGSTFLEKTIPVIGITGTGGAGKSSLVDELILRFIASYPKRTLAILSIDPSRKKSGGALLGDRIRMNAIHHPNIYMRSLATRQAHQSLSGCIGESIQICKSAGFDAIIIETSGIGQSDSDITQFSDISLYVMTPEFGAASQLEKIDMLDFADLIAINKFDKRGAEDALRDVKKQYSRNHLLFEGDNTPLPVFGTIASQFNDSGVTELFEAMVHTLEVKLALDWNLHKDKDAVIVKKSVAHRKKSIIPPPRVRYLSEIVEESSKYNKWVEVQVLKMRVLYQIHGSIQYYSNLKDSHINKQILDALTEEYKNFAETIDLSVRKRMEAWHKTVALYKDDFLVYQVREAEIKIPLFFTTLSGLKIPKISLPTYQDWGDLTRWLLKENLPGEFPYTAGVFPLKREGEDPTRMFAGEGGPERTNKRFHYVSLGLPAKRLSTAFDSVTLYGEDPHIRPDIYGKIGNAGVSIATVNDAKKLYSGFDLCDPATSVSMTINGPAPIVLAFFLNAAIDQQCEKYILEHGLEKEVLLKFKENYDDKGQKRPTYEGELPIGNSGLGLQLLGLSGDQVLKPEIYEKIKAKTLHQVRGTVQADILKEDQAQNTCIFSTEFALKMMGDIQAYFIDQKVRNFYSVSISGYHIAEAGANPITQLAFTLSNGFTFVEYYLSRGLAIDDFAPNLSFFFSNGIDIEYSVIGRVARRIWAKAIRNVYNGNERSQKLKYHIQTSGRSLHAQEIDFNDIRTTLQALYAIFDNCNSLHTNAYDEAITTPTEESVRRAMAIQMIINKELGLTKAENSLQGSFIIEELTDLVEEAVMLEFEKISERGGVLGAMETMYQRSRIQEESLYYEMLKHDGTLPIIGVNTFLNKEGSPTLRPGEVIRATENEKGQQIKNVEAFSEKNTTERPDVLHQLKTIALSGGNTFEGIMEASKVCTLGEITHALYEIGGQYRRNM